MQNKIRKSILINSFKAKACHLGSAMSCVEILQAIHEVKRKKDYFLFSKASGVSAFYALLGERGVIPKNKISYCLRNYPLAHKDVPGVIHSVGSIGHGLNVATGIAFADRKNKVYCLISDGELNEGSTWEAILFAAHHELKNLIVLCDFNRLQACGSTHSILELEDIREKMLAFNWECERVNGHDIDLLEYNLKLENNLPKIIVCGTIKGRGINFMENDYTWHYKNLDNKLIQRALKQL